MTFTVHLHNLGLACGILSGTILLVAGPRLPKDLMPVSRMVWQIGGGFMLGYAIGTVLIGGLQ